MEIWMIALRTFFIYFFILLVMRIMGKREIGKLSIFDLVVSIMIAELAVLSVENVKDPMLHSITPILVLMLTQIGLSYISLKSQKIRDLVDGKSSVLVEHGKIKEEELKRQRYNLDDLLLQLRENRIYSLSQVEFAILEPSGKLTVFPKEEEMSVTRSDLQLPTQRHELPTILIKDGEVQEDGLQKLGKNHFWLKSELKNRVGVSNFKEIMLCTHNSNGQWYIDKKEKNE
ncbi:DUF421 domain-containing protein [Bacillus horti]|uniref:Uncharacterized membrane protein YcaP (DUF421 family) n=1 Tax=Caldalkalibacillus horti TaxID=77523 RepID=A0ABT9VTD7_9BACI|nr:DUF421 domain-containing protein [Bacillus horti]MDQ0164247.1 uncharacterized membrane protein YcaP (DUF421 family) [Bacillus horti]